MSKFWKLVFDVAKLTGVMMAFWSCTLVAEQMAVFAIGSWEFYLAIVLAISSIITFYYLTWGLAQLEYRLGLYRALTCREPFREVRVRLDRRVLIILIAVSVFMVLVKQIYGAEQPLLLPCMYCWVVLPVGTVNAICGLLIMLLDLRMRWYLKARPLATCWYEYKLFWFNQGVVVKTYGRCLVCNLHDTLAEIDLQNYFAAVNYVSRLHPELSQQVADKAASQLLAYVGKF